MLEGSFTFVIWTSLGEALASSLAAGAALTIASRSTTKQKAHQTVPRKDVSFFLEKRVKLTLTDH